MFNDNVALLVARHHVEQFKNIVQRQERIVRSLRGSNAPADQAQRLLETMRYSLALAQDHVTRLEREAVSR